MAIKIKIKKGDKVRVISGSNKGSEGEVISIKKDTNKSIVEGVYVVKKHNKPSAQNPQGGIFEKEAPNSLSGLVTLEKSLLERLLSPMILTLF